MIRTIIGITFICITNAIAFGQDLKTYSGQYNDAEIRGEATYQYYENDKYERIYHGSFKFETGVKEGRKLTNKIYRKVNGSYNNNLKNGTWIYKWKYQELVGNFKNGVPHGKWINKEYNRSTKKFEVTEKATFIDGKSIGEFYYKIRQGVHGGFEITGSFNDKGYFDGEWITKWDNVEDIRKYKRGVLYFRLIRATETGEVGLMYDSTDFVNAIFENLELNSMTSKVGKSTYIMQDSDNKEFDNDEIFIKETNRLTRYGNGRYTGYALDDVITEITDNLFYNRFFGIKKGEIKQSNFHKRIVINYINTLEAKYTSLISEGDKHFAENEFSYAIDKYSSALKINSDEQYLKNKIDEAEKIISVNKKYEKLIDEGVSFEQYKKYNEAITSFQSAIDMQDKVKYPVEGSSSSKKYSNMNYPQNMIDNCNKKLEEIEIRATNKRYEEFIKDGIFYKDHAKYQKAITSFQSAIDMQDKIDYSIVNSLKYKNVNYPQELLDDLNKYLYEKKSKERVKELRYQTEDKHFKYERRFLEKKKLYFPYMIVYNYKPQNLDEAKVHYIDLLEVQDKFIYLLNRNSRKFEKQLKGVTNYKKIIEIFKQ